MAISLRLSDDETRLIQNYARLHGITVSELLRQSVIARIEDELDMQAYTEAIARYRANPVSYTHEQVAALLDLDEAI